MLNFKSFVLTAQDNKADKYPELSPQQKSA